ncbi:MAG: hypothetical protein Q8O67_34110 [Deltaproteobacteria bacterium]|nr:hypothetical protein [Deltaproteobacteria bacterium]
MSIRNAAVVCCSCFSLAACGPLSGQAIDLRLANGAVTFGIADDNVPDSILANDARPDRDGATHAVSIFDCTPSLLVNCPTASYGAEWDALDGEDLAIEVEIGDETAALTIEGAFASRVLPTTPVSIVAGDPLIFSWPATDALVVLVMADGGRDPEPADVAFNDGVVTVSTSQLQERPHRIHVDGMPPTTCVGFLGCDFRFTDGRGGVGFESAFDIIVAPPASQTRPRLLGDAPSK